MKREKRDDKRRDREGVEESLVEFTRSMPHASERLV